MQESLK